MGNSSEVIPLLSEVRVRRSSGLLRWQWIALLLLAVWLYAEILTRLFLQWVGPARDPNFDHGIFVPLFALFVIWQDRAKLKRISAEPAWVGLLIIVFSMLMLVVGVLGAELFLQRVSLLFLLAGLIILFRGWVFFRAVLFPWAFLILMIPLPNIILQQVTFPLQLLASKVAKEMLELVGVPVVREGNLIKLPAMPLDVAEACSGIRSLLTLVTLAIIYGYLMESRKWVRVVLACSAVPIAVAANSFRVFVTGLLVQYWDPDKAEGFFHTFQGWLIFVVSLVLLFAVHRLICIVWKAGPVAVDAEGDSAKVLRRNGDRKAIAMQFAIAGFLMLVTAVGLQAHSRIESLPARSPLSSLPSQIDGWSGTDDILDQATLDILGHPEYVLREYENSPLSQEPVDLFIAYYPSQKTGDTIHSPNHCLPGAGWVPTSKAVIQLSGADGHSFPANRYIVSKGEDRQLVLYWFQANGRAVASQWQAKYFLVADSIQMNRSDGSLIRLMTPMLHREPIEAAQARVMQLGAPLIPLLDRYIPR